MSHNSSDMSQNFSEASIMLKKLLDEADCIIQVSDLETRELLYVNKNAAEFAKRSQHGFEGMRCYEYMMHRGAPCTFCDLSGLTADGMCKEERAFGRHFAVTAKRIDWDGRDAFVEYVRDVTEHRETEAALRAEQEKFSIALENSDIIVWEYDPVNHVSVRTESCLGDFRFPTEMAGVPCSAIEQGFVHPDSAEEYIELYKRIDRGDDSSSARIKMLNRHGEPRWMKVEIRSIFDTERRPIRAIGRGIDITDQVEAEEKFAAFWNYRQTVKKNTIASFRMNLTANWCGDGISANPEVLEMNVDDTVDGIFNYAYERFPSEEELHRYKAVFSREALLKLFNKGETSPSLEYRYCVKPGQPQWIRAVVDMQRNPATGDVVALMYAFDINREKINEAIITKVIAGDYDFIMLVDIRMNSFSLFLGSDEQVIVPPQSGTDYLSMMKDVNDRGVLEDDIDRAIRDMTPETMEENLSIAPIFSSIYRAKKNDGGVSYKKIRYCWLDKSVGHIMLTRSDVTDEISEQARQQELLRSALTQAQQANRAKTDFLSKMSHEIRTPMNAIIGMNALAAQNPNNAEQTADCIAKVGISARYLLSLINDILDMSRIESGKVNLRNEPFPFEDFINGINSLVYEHASENGLHYDSIVMGFPSEKYSGDSMKLQQILMNLLGNAVKFTPCGGKVQLIVQQERADHDRAFMKFTVNDTGCGISEEFQRVMFDPFEQEHGGITSQYGGTGLGLAITKNLVELMGGSIYVNSIVGVGTEFIVTVPLGIVHDGETRLTRTRLQLEKMAALVVDDEIQICEQTKNLLIDIGMRAEWADSGPKAVQIVKERWRQKRYFDVILIDWKMPQMDGIETARRIRKIVGPEVTIIIITAYEWAEIEREAKAAGVNVLVTKPLFRSSLISTVERACSRHAEEAEKAPAPAVYDFTGKRALLVEDHVLNIEVAKRLLQARGMEVAVAENGIAAIEAFASVPTGHFDVILMDIRMPEMDGLTATRSIRLMKKKSAKTIPIIAMSANAFDEDVEKSRAAGMNAHLSKPIEPELLYATIARFLNASEDDRGLGG